MSSPKGIGDGEFVEIFRRYWWVVVSAWVLLAFVSWHYETTCGVFFSFQCFSQYWDGVRWVALLKWVSLYQTLLAGLAAIVGGYFVLKSQTIQIDENRKISTEAKEEAFRAALSTIRAECIHVADHLSSDDLHASNTKLVFTTALFPVLATSDARLLHITMSVTHRLEKALSEKAKGQASSFSQTKFLWYSSIGMAYAEMLMQIVEKLNAGEHAKISHASFDGSPMYKYLERRGQNPSILFELAPYFRWPVEQDITEDVWRPT